MRAISSLLRFRTLKPAQTVVIILVFAFSLVGLQAVSSHYAYADTPIDPVPTNSGFADKQNDCQGEGIQAGGSGENHCAILDLLLLIINTLSALVAVVIVAVIVAAGIRYSASAGDASVVADAKKRIRNALFALFMYIFMYGFLQWIVPGGVF